MGALYSQLGSSTGAEMWFTALFARDGERRGGKPCEMIAMEQHVARTPITQLRNYIIYVIAREKMSMRAFITYNFLYYPTITRITWWFSYYRCVSLLMRPERTKRVRSEIACSGSHSRKARYALYFLVMHVCIMLSEIDCIPFRCDVYISRCLFSHSQFDEALSLFLLANNLRRHDRDFSQNPVPIYGPSEDYTLD